ncbi:MAG: hypothetical protein U0414_26215 [Polyangiaceae bacterium]
MAEKSTKKPAADDDRGAEEERDDETSEEESEATAREDDSDADDEDEDDDADEADEPKGERDATTRGVATALGVDGDDEAEASEEDDDAPKAEAKPNRAQRRRDEAAKRRAAREGKLAKPTAGKPSTAKTAADAKDTEEEAEPAKELPRDKNARAKELLRRRQESAMGKRVSKLEASEVVQDRLARASSAIGGFLKNNFKAVAAVLVLGLAAAIGVSLFFSQRASAIAKRADDLNKGVLALRGLISPKPEPGYDSKKEVIPLYTSLEARADAAIAGFTTVATNYKGTAAATLARLGEGTALLDKRSWDAALAAFNEVVASPLAAADPDVKSRALEGAGYAKEGLEKWDEAAELFKQLAAVPVKGMDDLGKYHEARMMLKQGKIEDAKTALVELQKKLEIPTGTGSNSKLLAAGVDSALRQIDPTLVKKRTPSIGGMRGNALTPEQMQQMKAAELQKTLERLRKEGSHGDPGMPMPVPNDPGAP